MTPIRLLSDQTTLRVTVVLDDGIGERCSARRREWYCDEDHVPLVRIEIERSTQGLGTGGTNDR
jgi:hypothetical protein